MATLRQKVMRAAETLRAELPQWNSPALFIQLGAGFDSGGLLDEVLSTVSFDRLSGMGDSALPGEHDFRFTLGSADGIQVLIAEGRRHYYEGLGTDPCVIPVCAAVACGITRAILLSAGVATREELKPGTWVVLTDFVNNLGASPLVGNMDLADDCFPDMTTAFSQFLNSELVNASAKVGLQPRLGVYQADVGPCFATPTEAEVARARGVDVLGNSIVLETIAARTLGAEVAALALVTNMAAANGRRPLSHADVAEDSRFCSPGIMRTLRIFLRENLMEPDPFPRIVWDAVRQQSEAGEAVPPSGPAAPRSSRVEDN